MYQLQGGITMERIIFRVPSRTFDIAMPGDTHIGSSGVHWGGLDKLISYILAEQHRYWIHMGDWIDAICSDDKRFAFDANPNPRDPSGPIPLRQAILAAETFSPITARGICGLIGNHELKLHRFGNLTKDIICKKLGLAYGSYTARIIVMYGEEVLFRLFAWHGPAKGTIVSNAKDAEQRAANMKAALKMKMKYKMADCAVMAMGHVHKLLVVPPTGELYLHDTDRGMKADYLSGQQSGEYIHPDQRYYVCCGSFPKMYEDGQVGYAEVAGYDPVELGFPVIHVEDGQIVDIERRVV
jgi:hypothetical protein